MARNVQNTMHVSFIAGFRLIHEVLLTCSSGSFIYLELNRFSGGMVSVRLERGRSWIRVPFELNQT
jgi:hypothetical protein